MIKENKPVWISEVKQKHLSMSMKKEQKRQRSLTVMETSAPKDEPFTMEVTRPFFIAITDDETGAILFMGTISNPLQGNNRTLKILGGSLFSGELFGHCSPFELKVFQK